MADLISAQELFFNSAENKTSNRFILYIDGIPTYTIKSATRPKIVLETNEIHHININRKLKSGKTNWENMTIKLYDFVAPSTTQAVMEWIRLSHESTTGSDQYAQFYKKDITFNVLGPVGDIIEDWTIKGAYIHDADFGEMSWEEGKPMELTLTIAYDYAILQF